jgi:hypothetical protein
VQIRDMALVVFLRGVNVGGHRRFRPSVLARELSDHDVVSVGAAGTFVVRKPGRRARFRAELLRRLPFAAQVALCAGDDAQLEHDRRHHPHSRRRLTTLGSIMRRRAP